MEDRIEVERERIKSTTYLAGVSGSRKYGTRRVADSVMQIQNDKKAYCQIQGSRDIKKKMG